MAAHVRTVGRGVVAVVLATLVAATPTLPRPANADAAGATYHPLTPTRIVDSRVGLGAGGALVAGVARSFAVAGQAGIPAGATAVTGNLTATGVSAAGYLALTPVQVTQAQLSTSSVNLPAGDTRASGVTVPLGSDGRLWAIFVSARSGATSQFIFDVSGYFARATARSPVPLPAYFRGWLPNDAAPKDAAGVVMVDYGGSLGRQYNPLTVAQAAIGYYDRWRFSGETADRQAADHAAFMAQVAWLVRNQASDGRWFYRFAWGAQPVPWWSAMAEGVAISALLRAWSVTGDASYLTAVARARSTFERSRERAGVVGWATYSGRTVAVYEEYLAGYQQHVLNGWLFAVVGLYEEAVTLEDPVAWFDVLAADRGIAAASWLLPAYDSGSWSFYDLTRLGSSPPGGLASLTYHSIHIGELRYLGSNLPDPRLSTYAARFQAYLDACTASRTCPKAAPTTLPTGADGSAPGDHW